MNCRECRDYIDAYIDNELDVATVILVKQPRSAKRSLVVLAK